jgi:hypothetical protein
MILGEFKPAYSMEFDGTLEMTIKDIQIWSVIGITLVALLLFWAGALVYAYLANDVSPTPADERSVPAPRSH